MLNEFTSRLRSPVHDQAISHACGWLANTPSRTLETVFRLKETTGPSGLIKLEEPIPTPRAHEVLVRIHAVSLNYRDHVISIGAYPIGTKKDVVPFSDMAGEVVALGEAIRDFKIGDRVTANFDLFHYYGRKSTPDGALGAPIDGVLQEYRVFNETSLLHIPSHLTYEEASCWPCAGVTAWNALFGGIALIPGQTVLFQGTGGVSISGLILAHAAGARTIVTSSSDEKLELATKLGATHVINYKKRPDWEKVVLELTNGVGVDFIFDNVGITEIDKCFTCVAKGGVITAIGFLGGLQQGNYPNVSMLAIFKAATLRGINVGSKQLHHDLLRFVEVKQLRPYIDKVFSFEEAPSALEYLASGGHFGKIVVRVSRQ